MNLSSPSEHASLSRTASRASARSRNSTLSRNQSLIKKNIELQDLKPADVLIERFVAWKAIVKQLAAYFEGIADIENNTAKELTKLAGVIQVPFRAGNQFLGDGGLQDVFYNIRDKTRIKADQHADLGRTIDSSIVQHLRKLLAEIKAHIRNVQNDTGKLAAGVARERELSTKLVGELANSISTFKNTPMNIQARNDPYVANQAVARQLQRQVLEENLLQKSIVMMQQNSAHFEEGIVKSIQSAWQTFDEWQSRASAASQDIYRSLSAHLAAHPPDREWIQFAARSDHLLDPDTPLRDPELIKYPLKDDPSVSPVHTGHMERKKRFTRSYTESYFVLTPAGFLHEYSSSDPTTYAGQTPMFSLFLPSCTLGPASSPRASAHKFHIEGRKDGLGTTKSGSFKGILGGEGNKAWSFRCRSRDDMMEWWNDIRMLCARYLVASEQVDRTGPVEEAVRSVGYTSEDFEDELEDEEDEEEGVVGEERPGAAAVVQAEVDDGSSVEEEIEEHVYEDPPVYTHPADKHYPVEIGPNGYAIEKKTMSGNYGNEDPNVNYRNAKFVSPTVVRSGSHHDVQSQHAVAVDSADGDDVGQADASQAQQHEAGTGTGVARRLSKRQMEKAPEGRSSARSGGGGGGVGVDTRVSPTPPPPIQLRDPGVVPRAISTRESDDRRPASRHRSPPPRQHVEEEEEEGPEAGEGEGEDDDEGMYASEGEGEAGGDVHDSAAAAGAGAANNSVNHNQNGTAHNNATGPAPQQQHRRAQVEEVNEEEEEGDHVGGVLEEEEGQEDADGGKASAGGGGAGGGGSGEAAVRGVATAVGSAVKGNGNGK